jgi:putative component of toxin-antitoxin plasmid stabilization module
MNEYRILTTEEFESNFNELDNSDKLVVEKILNKLKEQGKDVGKPLSGLSIFREKKFGGKRLYYLIYENVLTILAIALSDKKSQQATINRILLDINEYQQYVFDQLRKKGII